MMKNAKIHVEDEKYTLFVNNRTKNGKETSKYNVLTFLPVNLFEQFRRIANLFFLIMTAIQLIPGIIKLLILHIGVSPYAVEVTIIPLVIILGLTAIKDGYEDWRRHKEDKITNSSLYSVLLPKESGDKGVEYKVLTSGELKVGDIVELHDGEAFPADLVVISSSEENGIVFIDTASLDGETNHKKRQAPKILYEKYKDENEFKDLNCYIECDVPDDQLNIFHGVMKFADTNEADISLDVINFLPRGAILRNTSKAYATIIYTGENTKLSRNQKEPKFKFSRIESLMNKFVPVIFAIQVILALLGGGLARLYDDTWKELGWSTGYSNVKNYFFDSCTFFILFSYLIPMSLYVGLEFSRLLQALFIAWDQDMFVEGEGGCLAKTSNLNDELGQIEYIFSDKTGTLTENLMLFRSCSIGAELYDEQRIDGMRNKTADIVIPIKSDITQYFLFCLSLCHEVSPEIRNDKINYRSESPDELALMEACEILKCPLKQRNENKMIVQYQGESVEFDILHLLQFNSDRKRMCVITRKLDNKKIYVFSKGADSAIMTLSSKTFGMDCIYQDDVEYQNILNKTNDYLTLFSQKGYRTLLYAGKQIEEEDYENWKIKLTDAENSLKDREQLIDSVFKEIENGMYIVGCTAVEDKLQDNLPETLSSFLAAGIQFGVATGDKLETAVNIGYNCGLLTKSMKLLYIKGDDEDSLKESISNLLNTIQNNPNETYALIVVGDQCDICIKSLIDNFSLLFSKCATAICCRMTPLQKSKMVKLVREKMKKCCLGIGDGANDVSMILEANVGVGVFGKEGRQAVNNSDYAIRKFHHLKKLLFVHGRWNYFKCAFLVYFAFYNNLSFSIPQFLIGIFSGFTGCNMYPSAVLSVYNILFSGPVFMAFGFFYEDVTMQSLMDNPECYKRLISNNRFFSYRNYFQWLFLSILQGLLSFFVPYLSYSYSEDVLTSKSYSTGFYVFGLVVISINIWGNFFVSSICVSRWNFFNICFIVISIPLFYIVMFISAAMDGVNVITIAKNFQISLIWLIIIIGCGIGFLIKFTQVNFLKIFTPTDIDIIKEIEHVKGKDEKVRDYILKEIGKK